jgi:hypothetical protein
MPKPTVLAVGDTQRPEFREARAVLDRMADVVPARDIDAAVDRLAEGRLAADLIVLAQAYPGQYRREGVERLRRLAPLARLLALLGSWCEGESRSGDPWPAAVRVYWHQWPARCGRELAGLAGGLRGSWTLPATAGDEERLLALNPAPGARREGLIVVCAQQVEMGDWLADACRQRGYATVWVRPGESVRPGGARAAIFDGADADAVEADQLRGLAESLEPAPVVALLDFPRIEDQARAVRAGAAAVLSKPLLLEDLFWQLDRLLMRTGEPPAFY